VAMPKKAIRIVAVSHFMISFRRECI
jgi:hypothetical protein